MSVKGFNEGGGKKGGWSSTTSGRVGVGFECELQARLWLSGQATLFVDLEKADVWSRSAFGEETEKEERGTTTDTLRTRRIRSNILTSTRSMG
jgi:hypothetical protein